MKTKLNDKKCQVTNVGDAFSIYHKRCQNFCFMFLWKDSKAIIFNRCYVASHQNMLWYKWTSMKAIPVNSKEKYILHTRTKSTWYFYKKNVYKKMRLKWSRSSNTRHAHLWWAYSEWTRINTNWSRLITKSRHCSKRIISLVTLESHLWWRWKL